MELIIAIFSFIFSTIAFFFTLKSELKQRVNLKIFFPEETISEWQVDRTENDQPDVYFQNKFRLFPTVSITNNSSLPITITEFTLNDNCKFSFYTKVGSNYIATYSPRWIKMDSGIQYHNALYKAIAMDIEENELLRPPFTIKPYESKIGVIFFHYNESFVGKNELILTTSRGKKKFPLLVSKQYVSREKTDYPPPKIDIQ